MTRTLQESQEKRVQSLLREIDNYEVYQVDGPLFWVVNTKNNKGYEVWTDSLRCSCSDNRHLWFKSITSRDTDNPGWAFCKHLLLSEIMRRKLVNQEVEVKYVESLPLVEI